MYLIHRFLLLPPALQFLALPSFGADDVVLNDTNLVWLPGGIRSATLALPPQAPPAPHYRSAATGEATDLLKRLDAAGQAHGFGGTSTTTAIGPLHT
jgi:hypothetical protein